MQKLVEKLGMSEGAASAMLWIILSLVLLGIVALLALWLVRMLRPSLNINGSARGGRPQRLAITDAFALDRDGRKLVIVRRDNTEHLLLIGGPNDVLVEANITRFDRSGRNLSRAPETADEAPADLAPPPAPLRIEPSERPAIEPRPAAPMAPPVAPVMPRPAPVPPPLPAPPLPAPPAPAPKASPPPMLSLEALLPSAQPVVRLEPAPAPPPLPPIPPVAAPPAPPAAPPPPVVAAPLEAPAAPAPRPPAMSEMARRLNEALQKPMSGTLRPPFNRSIPPAPPAVTAPPPAPVSQPAPEAALPPEPPLEPAPPPAPPAPPAPAAEPVAQTDMDLLEEEMARLLGRPAAPKKPDAS